jgi:stalled ribosome rescue protein Dom34
MATKAGVWIDHTQAIVVLITDAGMEFKKIKSDLEKRPRATGRAKSATPYTKNDFLAEDRRRHKIEDHRKKYYDEVIACLRGTEAFVILGPGEAKGEFSKRIKSHKLRVNIVELETTDKMTDRQLASKVAEHFAPINANKAAASRKTARKKAAAATARRLTKKQGK